MIDEDLLAPLRTDPPGQPRIDVPRAMVEGRRRRRHRQWASGAAIVAVAALAATGGVVSGKRLSAPDPVATRPPKSCTVTALPDGGVASPMVTAVDPTGHYFVGWGVLNNKFQAMIWKDGTLLPLPRGSVRPEAINSHGVAVGAGGNQGYVFRDDRVTPLAGGNSDALAINDAGMIVGRLGGTSDVNGVPARWRSADGPAERLPLPAGMKFGEATGITEDGTVWGDTGPAGPAGSRSSVATLWFPDGSVRRLSPPPGLDPVVDGGFGIAKVANGKAYLPVGRSLDFGGPASYVAYDIAKNSYQPLPPYLGSYPTIAANGWMAGQMEDPTTFDPYPVLRDGTSVTRLPEPAVGSHARWNFPAMSSDGRVIGGFGVGYGSAGDPESFVWTCE